MRLERHSIYGYPQCPYCARVLRAVDALGLEVEFRNIHEVPEHQRELVEATGRTTVPVLRIESKSGEARWIPESTDIVAYLEEAAGN